MLSQLPRANQREYQLWGVKFRSLVETKLIEFKVKDAKVSTVDSMMQRQMPRYISAMVIWRLSIDFRTAARTE